MYAVVVFLIATFCFHVVSGSCQDRDLELQANEEVSSTIARRHDLAQEGFFRFSKVCGSLSLFLPFLEHRFRALLLPKLSLLLICSWR